MGLGKDVRLARLFSHGSGKLFGVAVDHFVGYGDVRTGGLADLPAALGRTMRAEPDSVTVMPGAAKHLWPLYAGKAALIVQGGMMTPDDRVRELVASPEDAVRMGADALAVSIGVRGAAEGSYLRWLADSVREAARYDMPVVAHIYPRNYEDEPRVEFTPDQIAWAVRAGIELGVDVIKVGYPGDESAFADIVSSCPAPIVIAGGPKTDTLEAALEQTTAAMRCGAQGAVVGRNIWGQENVVESAFAFKGVIHDGLTAAEALKASGLQTAAAS